VRLAAVLTTCAVAMASREAMAQRVSSALDVGATNMKYADSVAASGLSITPMLQLSWPRTIIRGTGTYAQLGAGHWSTQGLVSASVFSPAAQHLSGELSLSSGGSAHFDGTRTGQSLLALRGHFDRQNAGVWTGGAGGLMWDGFRWHPVGLGELGAWARARHVTFIGTATPSVADDTIRYVDTELDARYEGAYVTLGVLGGFRNGRGIEIGSSSRAWGGAAMTIWPTAHLGIVVSGGTYPVDLTQGFPGGQYLFINVRIGSRPRTASSLPVSGPTDDLSSATSDRAGVTLSARQAAAGNWELRVQAPMASRVELNGDFTRWQPTPLVSTPGGAWTLTLPLASGTYQLNLRIDGGPWIVPRGLLEVTDEFGGRVGLLVIP